MAATRLVLSAIVIGRAAPMSGQKGRRGTGIMIGPEGIRTTGTDRSEVTIEAALRAREPAVPARFDTLSVKAPNVTLDEGQINRFRIIA